MALPGWGALAYVANSAYSYATGTYLPSDAKRLRCVQTAYQKVRGRHTHRHTQALACFTSPGC